jgi:hypothetical protein
VDVAVMADSFMEAYTRAYHAVREKYSERAKAYDRDTDEYGEMAKENRTGWFSLFPNTRRPWWMAKEAYPDDPQDDEELEYVARSL